MGTGYQGQGGDLQQPTEGLTLKDYTHASKTFLTNGFELSPRLKFLYHVYFNINTGQIPQLKNIYGSGTVETLGMMVKSIELPKYKINTTVMNQYNRKRVVQSKINYEPCRFTLHDDQSDLIRNMWYNYFTYYYKDATQKYDNVSSQNGSLGLTEGKANGFNYNTSDIYSQSYQNADWGFVGESYTDGANAATNANGKPAFFKDITIYALSQKKYAAWVLINPLITSWNGDSFDYSEGGGTMKDDVTVEYETVKYYSGAIGGTAPSTSVKGFADPGRYDTTPSGISRPGATNSVFGQSGVLPAVQGTTRDLQTSVSGQNGLQNVVGGVQQAVAKDNTFTLQNPTNSVKTALQASAVTTALNNQPTATRAAVNSSTGMVFPKALTSAVPALGIAEKVYTAVSNGGSLTPSAIAGIYVDQSVQTGKALAGLAGGLLDIGKSVASGNPIVKAVRNVLNGDI
jgi:hypothetical protein